MKYKDLIIKYKQLLDQSFPKPIEKRKTFLEIGNVPHYENVISNFYCFYFDKNEEHKFGELFLKSLCDIIIEKTDKSFEFEDYSVYREVSTKNGGRIDILIEENSEQTAIIIENKVYHSVLNDLNDYWQSVKAKNNNKIGIVLTLEKQTIQNKNFINITHQQFLKKVKSNIGFYLKDSDDRHLLFLKDLFDNISNLILNKNDMKDTLKFYFENKDKIYELSQIKEKARKHFLSSIKETSGIIGIELENSNPKEYRCLIISKRPGLRYWLQLNQDPEEDFFTIYLDLTGNTQKFSDLILSNKQIIKKANEKGITLSEEFDAYKGGKSVAYKNYSLTSDDFIEFGKFIAEKIENDWTEIVEKVKMKIKNEA